MSRIRPLIALAVLAAACAEPPTTPVPPGLQQVSRTGAVFSGGRYVIIGANETLPANLAAAVASAGGTVTAVHDEIGVAYATSASATFASQLGSSAGIEDVAPDVHVQWVEPPVGRAQDISEVDAAALGAADPLNDALYFLQWAPRAIQAPDAWNLGYTGRGVRVAILDGGIYHLHPDIAPNLDVASSRSFVPGFAYNTDGGTFWHGTHVAGIVAAADNTTGTIGIAPGATLVGVKVLHNGSGDFGWVIDGIMYAATDVAKGGAGADIINMSLGATLRKEKDPEIRKAIRQLKKAVDRATKYAHRRGVTVIASAGNDGINVDEEKDVFKTPAMNKHVIAVSATGPHGWALGATNFDRPTYYTDHGKSLVDVAAPGGTVGLFVVDGVDAICVVGGIQRFCETFDMVLSTTRNGWNWAQGTSMAAPAAAAVAALIIEKDGGKINPDKVRNRLEKSAIDLGKKGKDAFYGHGWVNALRAVQ